MSRPRSILGPHPRRRPIPLCTYQGSSLASGVSRTQHHLLFCSVLFNSIVPFSSGEKQKRGAESLLDVVQDSSGKSKPTSSTGSGRLGCHADHGGRRTLLWLPAEPRGPGSCRRACGRFPPGTSLLDAHRQGAHGVRMLEQRSPHSRATDGAPRGQGAAWSPSGNLWAQRETEQET